MKEIVIVEGTRTPIGTFGGSLRDITANELSPFIIDAVIKRTGIEKKTVDQVILGNCFEGVEHNVARIGLVRAGLPVETAAYQVVATCGSGMQAIICGAQGISHDDVSCVIAGGIESMSTAPTS